MCVCMYPCVSLCVVCEARCGNACLYVYMYGSMLVCDDIHMLALVRDSCAEVCVGRG